MYDAKIDKSYHENIPWYHKTSGEKVKKNNADQSQMTIATLSKFG